MNTQTTQTANLGRWVVMIVDDDAMIRKILTEHLQLMGFRNFIEARDGSEAYKAILDPLQRIDLILCDWEMPRTDGLTLLRALRSHSERSATPFIMITSQQSQERMKISNAKRSKVNDYIIKPFQYETLQEKVLSVIFANLEKRAAS